MISPFTGDFAYRLNVAAADYAGSFAGAREHASVDAFEELVVRTITPNGFVVVWWRAGLWSVSVSSLLLLSGQGSALRTENTVAVAGLWRG